MHIVLCTATCNEQTIWFTEYSILNTTWIPMKLSQCDHWILYKNIDSSRIFTTWLRLVLRMIHSEYYWNLWFVFRLFRIWRLLNRLLTHTRIINTNGTQGYSKWCSCVWMYNDQLHKKFLLRKIRYIMWMLCWVSVSIVHQQPHFFDLGSAGMVEYYADLWWWSRKLPMSGTLW